MAAGRSVGVVTGPGYERKSDGCEMGRGHGLGDREAMRLAMLYLPFCSPAHIVTQRNRAGKTRAAGTHHC